MVEKKDRKKKIITSLAIGSSVVLGGGFLARKLLKKNVLTSPVKTNKVTEVINPRSPKVTEVINTKTNTVTPVAKAPQEIKEVVNPKVVENTGDKLLKGDDYKEQLLPELKRRRSDRRKAVGDKQPDLPKQPRQKLDVKKREGLNLPKQPREKLNLKPQPPELDELVTKNKLESDLANKIFPSSKLVSSKTKINFPRKLRLRIKPQQGKIRFPRRPRYDVEIPIRQPDNLESALGIGKKISYEDLIKEVLEKNISKGADFPKLLPPASTPRLGEILVKGYKKKVNGKIITVKDHFRKVGIKVGEGIEASTDKGRRETIRRVRQLRAAARRRQEQIEINNLQYQKLLDDQVSNKNDILLDLDNLFKDLDNTFVSTENNLKKLIPIKQTKGYKTLIDEIDITKPVVKNVEIDGDFFDNSLTNLNKKLDDVLEGFDYDDKLLKEIKIEKTNKLNELRNLRNKQKQVVKEIETKLAKTKKDKKLAEDLLASYKRDYDTFIRTNKEYENNLELIRLKKLELENVAPSTVGKEFYTGERVNLIKQLDELEKGKIKKSDYVVEIENKIKELEDNILFLTKERDNSLSYNKSFNKKLNRYESELNKIPTNRFFIKNDVIRKNEKLNKIIAERVNQTNRYLEIVEKDVKNKIDLPLKELEKNLKELEKKVSDIDIVKLRENVEQNLREREIKISDADNLAERYYLELKEFLEDEDKLKSVMLENIPMKRIGLEKSLKGENLTLDEALTLKKRKIEELRKQAIYKNNEALFLMDRKIYSLNMQRFQSSHKAKEMPHISYLKQLISELENRKAVIKNKRDNLFSTLNNYNFAEVKEMIRGMRNNGLYAYYKNTNPELYKRIMAFEDLLENKIPNRYKYLLEDLDYQISKLDKDAEFLSKELKELVEKEPKIKIKTGETVLNVNPPELDNIKEGSLSVGKPFIKEAEIKEFTGEELDKRALDRYVAIQELTKATRKRVTLLPVYERLNSKGFKVEGENSIFNNYRKGKLTPAQDEFIKTLKYDEKNFFEKIIEQDLDDLSINYYYLNRAKDYLNNAPKRKTKLKKVKSLIDSLNVAKGADLRYKNREGLRLTMDKESGLLKLENYESLGRLTNREKEILNTIEKELGINGENVPSLGNISLMAKVSKGDLSSKSQIRELLKEVNNSNLSFNEYIYLSTVLKERLRGISNELYLNNFSDTLELVKF